MRVRRLAASAVEPRRYLEGANLAFGEWGDEATFAWVFRDDAELLFIEDAAGRTIAASGITWRTLLDGQRAAIMTGSWTLAQARGSGAFSTMIEATRTAALEQHAILLGFGRMENASGRRLDAAGAKLDPMFYCRSPFASKPSPQIETVESVEPDPAAFRTSFLYTPDEWRMQFLQRPHAHIESLGQRGAWSAIMERTPQFDRVHALSRTDALPLLATRAHAQGRRLFWYATRTPETACEWTAGFLASLPPQVIEWELQNGDRV